MTILSNIFRFLTLPTEQTPARDAPTAHPKAATTGGAPAAPAQPVKTGQVPAARALREQSPADMLKILKRAERLGVRTVLDSNNNLALQDIDDVILRNVKAPSFWARLKTLFDRKSLGPESQEAIFDRNPVGIENRQEIVGTVIKKMRKHIDSSAKHIAMQSDDIIREHLPAVGRFAQTGKVGELETEWIRLQNILQRGIGVVKKGPPDQLKNNGDVRSVDKFATTTTKPATIRQNSEVAASRAQNIPGPTTTDEHIAEANLALPAAMPRITRLGETVNCTLTLPTVDQLKLFSDWNTWGVHAKNPADKEPDPFTGLSEAFFKDSNRTKYVFEGNDGFPIECDRKSEAVALGFKKAVGNNISRQFILSHLLGQEPLKRMLENIQKAHPTRDNQDLLIFEDSTSGSSANKIHTTFLTNGDVEIDFQSLQKTPYLSANTSPIKINQSKNFAGPVTPDNAGISITMKILVSGKDMDRGRLVFQIIDPLKAKLQVELSTIQP